MPMTTRTRARLPRTAGNDDPGRNPGASTHSTVGVGTSAANGLFPSAYRPGHPNSTGTTRYYCHTCDSRMESVNPDFTCPTCSTGFVEENAIIAPTPTGGDAEDDGPSQSRTHRRVRLYAGDYLWGERPTGTQAVTPPTEAPGIGPPPRAFIQLIDRGIGSQGQRAHRAPIPLIPIPLHRSGGMSVTFQGHHVNLTDFVLNDGVTWTQRIAEGMVQNRNLGPPPLSAKRLQELKQVEVTEGDVEAKTQCCVCLQEFILEESVTRLECSHIYHNGCIVPWLELHGTCPLCRNDMTENQPPPTSTLRITRQRHNAQNDPDRDSMIQPSLVSLDRMNQILSHLQQAMTAPAIPTVTTNSNSSLPQPPLVSAEIPTSSTVEEVVVVSSTGPGPSASSTESTPALRRPGRRYRKEEGQAILDYMSERDLFESAGDDGMWMDMEMANVGNSRSFQSLKQHFRTTVLPKLSDYYISSRNKRRLEGFFGRVTTRSMTATAMRAATRTDRA